MSLYSIYYESISSKESAFLCVVDLNHKQKTVEHILQLTGISHELLHKIEFKTVSENDAIGLMELETTAKIEELETIDDNSFHTIEDLMNILSKYKKSNYIQIGSYDELEITIDKSFNIGEYEYFRIKFNKYIDDFCNLVYKDKRFINDQKTYEEIKYNFLKNIDNLDLSEEELQQLIKSKRK